MADNIRVISTLESAGNFPTVEAGSVGVGNKRLDAILTSLAEETSKKASTESVSNINANVSTIETKVNALSSRMDSFSKLEDGSTTGDAELIDGRIGGNGVTYNNIGSAIRGQYSELKNDIKYNGDYVDLVEKAHVYGYSKVINAVIRPGEITTSKKYVPDQPSRACSEVFSTEDDFKVVNNSEGKYSVGCYAWDEEDTYKDSSHGSHGYTTSSFSMSYNAGWTYALFIKKSDGGDISAAELSEIISNVFVCEGKYRNAYYPQLNLAAVVTKERAPYSGYGEDNVPVLKFKTGVNNYISLNTDIDYIRYYAGTEMQQVSIDECNTESYDSTSNNRYLYFNPDTKTFISIGAAEATGNHLNITKDCIYLGTVWIHKTFSRLSKTAIPVQVDNEVVGMPYARNLIHEHDILFDGDSITYGVVNSLVTPRQDTQHPWCEFTCKMLGYAWNKAEKDIAVSGCTVSKYSGRTDSVVERSDSNDYSNSDIIVIAGGTNDWSYGQKLGDNYDTTDTKTIYGAYNHILSRIYADNKFAKVFILTPMQRFLRSGTYMNPHTSTNGNGVKLQEFCKAIEDYCKYKGVPCLNMFENSVINEWNRTNPDVGGDGLHLGEVGYVIMGKKVAAFIKSNM